VLRRYVGVGSVGAFTIVLRTFDPTNGVGDRRWVPKLVIKICLMLALNLRERERGR